MSFDLVKAKLPVTLYGRPNFFYMKIEGLIEYGKPSKAIEAEYKFVVTRLDGDSYDYESFFGEDSLNKKFNCNTDILKEEINLGNLRLRKWLS